MFGSRKTHECDLADSLPLFSNQPAVSVWPGCKGRRDVIIPDLRTFQSLSSRRSDFRLRVVQQLIEELDAPAQVRALGIGARCGGAGVSARPQAARLREAAWWEAAGPSEQPQGRDRPPTRRTFPEAMPARNGRSWRKSS